MSSHPVCKLCGSPTTRPTYNLGDGVVYACMVCDFHFLDRLDPTPADEGRQGPSLSAAGHAYLEERLSGNARLLGRRLELVRSYRALPGARCLDLGSGVGQFLQLLTMAGAEAQGIEPSRLRRDFASERLGLHLDGRRIEDPYWQRSCAAGFDLVTLWDVLEHVNAPVATLAGVQHVLAPGGLLFIETPSRDSIWYRLSEWSYRCSHGRLPLFLPSFYPNVPYGHKQIFRPGQLLILLERLGFELLALAASQRGALRQPGGKRKALGAGFSGQLVVVARKAGGARTVDGGFGSGTEKGGDPGQPVPPV